MQMKLYLNKNVNLKDLKSYYIDENCSDLSLFYATCKQHKSTIKFRYITSTTNAVSKPSARVMKACFSSIPKEVIP